MIMMPGGYAISADNFSYKVGIPSKRKDGKTDLAETTYHRSPADAVQNVLHRLIRDKVADGSIPSIRELLAEIEEQRKAIEELIAPLEC